MLSDGVRGFLSIVVCYCHFKPSTYRKAAAYLASPPDLSCISCNSTPRRSLFKRASSCTHRHLSFVSLQAKSSLACTGHNERRLQQLLEMIITL